MAQRERRGTEKRDKKPTSISQRKYTAFFLETFARTKKNKYGLTRVAVVFHEEVWIGKTLHNIKRVLIVHNYFTIPLNTYR